MNEIPTNNPEFFPDGLMENVVTKATTSTEYVNNNKRNGNMIIIKKHGNTMKNACCDNCGCEFLYQEKDILEKETRITAYDSEIEYRYIKCPECNHTIKL